MRPQAIVLLALLGACVGVAIYFIMQKHGVWARYVRVKNSAGDVIRIVYLGAKDSDGKRIPVTGGRLVPTAYKHSDLPSPEDLSGNTVSDHWSDWRYALLDNGLYAHADAGGPNGLLEFDYGKDVQIDKIELRTLPTYVGHWIVQLINDAGETVVNKAFTTPTPGQDWFTFKPEKDQQ